MFASALNFSGPYRATSDRLGLAVPLISQYQGLATDNVNCGPASVAAILRAVRPGGLPPDDASLMAALRNRSGAADGDTSAAMLIHALHAFGVGSTALEADDAPDGRSGVMAAIAFAIENRRPVLALVSGVDLGRGAAYGDHWLTITAVDKATERVRVADPDTQSAHTSDWQPGGVQWLPMWQVSTALRDATGDGSVVALAVGAGRSTPPSPRAVLPPLAAMIILWQMRRRLLRALPKRYRRALRRWARR